MTRQNVGLVAAGSFLLKELGRPRWAVVLLFPLIHSVWIVVGGLAAFSTGLPLVILGWALTVRWLRRLDVTSGIALASCLCATVLWTGIAYVQLGLAFAVLWALWLAPSLRAQMVSVPTVPSLDICAAWIRSTFVGTPSLGRCLDASVNSQSSTAQGIAFAGSRVDRMPHAFGARDVHVRTVPCAGSRALTDACPGADGILRLSDEPP